MYYNEDFKKIINNIITKFSNNIHKSNSTNKSYNPIHSTKLIFPDKILEKYIENQIVLYYNFKESNHIIEFTNEQKNEYLLNLEIINIHCQINNNTLKDYCEFFFKITSIG